MQRKHERKEYSIFSCKLAREFALFHVRTLYLDMLSVSKRSVSFRHFDKPNAHAYVVFLALGFSLAPHA